MIIKNMGLFWKPENVNWGKPGPGGAGRLLGYARLDKEKFSSPDVEEVIANESDQPRGKKIHQEFTTVDFRKQIGIYALYQDFKIVYVGQAGPTTDIFSRLRVHKTDHLTSRWNNFSWFGLKKVDLKESNKDKIHQLCDLKEETHSHATIVDHLEGILIEVLENIENRQGASFNGTVKFLQLRDPNLPLTINEMIKDLHDKMSSMAPQS